MSKIRKGLFVFLGAALVYSLSQLVLSFIFVEPQFVRKDIVKEVTSIYRSLFDGLSELYELDRSRAFQILYDRQLKNSTNVNNITLVTQCSSNRLNFVAKLYQKWQGPMSVAVFSELNNLKDSLLAVSLLKYCMNTGDIHIHLVLPAVDLVQYIELSKSEVQSLACEETYYTRNVVNTRNYNRSSPYPVNLLRNVAKLGSTSDYLFTIDVDMMPSQNLLVEFLHFAKRNRKERAVYVVPAFEVAEKNKVPLTKQELKAMARAGDVRPFYGALCAKCQKYTDYTRWLSLPDTTGVGVAYSISWKDPWEPFYIGTRGVPNYDERFQQYGFNRISQVCEVHVAGYEFAVLDKAFLVHVGFKKKEDFHNTKNLEQEWNRKLFRVFKQELKTKYPKSRKRCY